MLRHEVNLEWVLIPSDVGTEPTRLFGSDSALVLQVPKQVFSVVVWLEALRTLVRLFRGFVKWLDNRSRRICKRKKNQVSMDRRTVFQFHVKLTEDERIGKPQGFSLNRTHSLLYSTSLRSFYSLVIIKLNGDLKAEPPCMEGPSSDSRRTCTCAGRSGSDGLWRTRTDGS